MPLEGLVNTLVAFAILAGIYGLFTLGLNVHWGFTGLFNIGVAGFFAVGAYTSTLVTMQPLSPEQASYIQVVATLGLPFVLGVLAAGAASGAVAFLIGVPGLRLREDYLAIATIGIAEAIRILFNNERWLANGARGLSTLKPLWGALPPGTWPLFYLLVVAAFLLAAYLVVERSGRSPWGRVLRAIREDEAVAAAYGKSVFAFKLQSLVFGAVLMGMGGALYAHYIGFISPDAFDPLYATFLVWVMLILGGSGNSKGAILGAFLVWGVWEVTRYLADAVMPAHLDARKPYVRFTLIGLLLTAVLLWRPRGVLGEEKQVSRV